MMTYEFEYFDSIAESNIEVTVGNLVSYIHEYDCFVTSVDVYFRKGKNLIRNSGTVFFYRDNIDCEMSPDGVWDENTEDQLDALPDWCNKSEASDLIDTLLDSAFVEIQEHFQCL